MTFPYVSRRVAAIVALLAAAILTPTGAAPAQESTVSCRIEWASMRDGVTLATEVYLPSAPGRYPVILTRSPYNRNELATGSNCDNAQLKDFARNGYVALNQDTRGRYRSKGAFNPFQQEATDGYDAVEWAAAQPWSNGKVGVFGGSYVGATTWQATSPTPPHLVAAAPEITASDYHDNWTYVNGAFDLHINLSWTLANLALDSYRRSLDGKGLSIEEIDRRVAAWFAAGRRDFLTTWVWKLPLNSFSEFKNVAPYYYDWLAHPTYDAYWEKVDLERRYASVTVPTLNTGGWYDVFGVGTMRNFLGVRKNGGSAAARTGAKLVITCCGHARAQGLIDWGPKGQSFDAALNLRWFDHYLKGIDNGVDHEPAVQLFVMTPPDTGRQGGGFYVSANDYPLANTQMTAFHLRSNGHANTRSGDGALGPEPSEGLPDRFVYDPKDPVPTMGGNLCCGDFLMRGALDQSQVELRKDILVYTSAPLTQDLVIIGPVMVKLWAASSAPDTDFTAKLVDVHLDDMAHNVLDRIVRARYRDGSKTPPSLITPAKAYEYTIDLGHTGTVFRTGHRIRLEISSSNFPHFDRNPNTGHAFGQDAELVTATQTIFHDAAHPSYLELPVVPGVQIPAAALTSK